LDLKEITASTVGSGLACSCLPTTYRLTLILEFLGGCFLLCRHFVGYILEAIPIKTDGEFYFSFYSAMPSRISMQILWNVWICVVRTANSDCEHRLPFWVGHSLRRHCSAAVPDSWLQVGSNSIRRRRPAQVGCGSGVGPAWSRRRLSGTDASWLQL